MRYRIAVDTGGTFSDFIVFDEQLGTYRIIKVPSTPDDPGRAAARRARHAGRRTAYPPTPSGCSATAPRWRPTRLLEGRGARAGLVVTEGFRGIYETMEQSRPFGRAIFDLSYRKPPLLTPQSRTVEVAERIGATGEVRRQLDEESVARAVDHLEAEGVEAVAICLLFSYANPAHEQRVVELVRARHPEWWITPPVTCCR